MTNDVLLRPKPRFLHGRILACLVVPLLLCLFGGERVAHGQARQLQPSGISQDPGFSRAANTARPHAQPSSGITAQLGRMLSPNEITSSVQMVLLLTVLSLAPSILIMTTCFVRFVVILGLLRQALGTQQLPPNQVLTSLSLFMTFLVMAPVWQESYEAGIRPYTNPAPGEVPPAINEVIAKTLSPLREFMADQIEHTHNSDAVWRLLDYVEPAPDSAAAATYQTPETYEDVPTTVLLPAFMLSELKTAFVIGFQLYLPFVVIDMVVSSVLMSMGMMMLPPVLVSLPLKLLLFVMIDGWSLTVDMMLHSVAGFG